MWFIIIVYNFAIYGQNNSTQTHIGIKYLTLQDGLSQVTINDLIKDSSGFVWLATANGLNRFDGKEIVHFKHNESDSTSISGNFINKLLEDSSGNIWVGTNGDGLNYYNRSMDIFHKVNLKNAKNQHVFISALIKDRKGVVWVATETSGLFRLHLENNKIIKQDNFFKNKKFRSLMIDGNNLWMGSANGQVFKMGLESKLLSEGELIVTVPGKVQAMYKTNKHLLIGCESGFYMYNLERNDIQSIELDIKDIIQTRHVATFLKQNSDEVWIGTGNGLYLFDLTDKTVVRKIGYSEIGGGGLSNNTVQSLLRVSSHQIFVGTANGLNLIDFKVPYFRNISKNKKGKHLLNDNVIFSIFKDGTDLWVGTSDGGLNLIRNDTTYFFNVNLIGSANISGSVIRSIIKDKKNERLWIGTTRGLGLINLKTFDPNRPKFTSFQHNPSDKNSISHDFIKDIALDRNNNIWGATFGQGIFRLEILNNKKIKVVRYKNEEGSSNSIRSDITQCIRVDKNNVIWVGTQGGLTRLIFKEHEYKNPEFTNYFKVNNIENSLSHNSVYDILIDKQERMWLGTRNGLNLFLGDNKFKSWKEQKQFPNAVIYSLQDDLFGNLWLGTNDGLVNFNTDTNSFTHYSVEDNIQSKEFDIHARFRDSDGVIYMGGIEGITYFNPNILGSLDETQQLYFSQLRVKDKIVKPSKNSGSLINQTISSTHDLTFKHNQFPFYLKFSTIDYRTNKNIEFAYRLLPSNSDWNILKDSEIQFLNLPSGNHKLQINGFSRGKEWAQAPLELNLNILPPWWATWWAYTLYVIVLVFLADRFYRFQLSEKLAITESERLKEVSELKNRLYTNITHEFRTPLTVIKGMTDTIKIKIEKKELDNLDDSFEMIERNSDNLLSLINDMMDLSKMDSGNMELHFKQANIISFLKYVGESFNSFANQNNINLTVYSELDCLVMDFDEEKLASVISNLLSNAIKFTPEFGKIIIHINQLTQKGDKFLFIKIKDNGIGMSKEELPNIFNRFYQADDSTVRKSGGTGIGLALTKELVELMNGTIQVTSTLNKGSEFVIMIPVSKNAPLKNEIEFKSLSLLPKSKSIQVNVDRTLEEDSDLPLVLIIEDNMDIVHYLMSCLAYNYRTIYAPNGIEGIELALESIPDIIICDVMMPGKDGFEVCETLKTDERTDHIPIIILTAKVTKKDRLTGLSKGADAYLAKPFNKEELFTRLGQLISVRKKLINKIQKEGLSTLLNKRQKNPKLQFLRKITKLIHKNMNDSDFGSEALARKLLISESQIYRKIKAITDKSTAVYIRSIRLQYAKEMLLNTNKIVSEVAYDTGFNDPAWFSRIFKDEFGFAPSDTSK